MLNKFVAIHAIVFICKYLKDIPVMNKIQNTISLKEFKLANSFNILALIFIVLINNVWSATYFVSNTGNNMASGSSSAPFLTIQFAIDLVSAGDTIVVKNGIYMEMIRISNSGNINNHIVLISENQHQAKLISTGVWYEDIIKIENANYWEINGFEIYHEALHPEYYGHGIYARFANHISIKNNLIHDMGGSGIQFDKFDYAHVENNEIYNCAFYNPFQCSGISLYQARAYDQQQGYHNIIKNNICYFNENKLTFPTTDGNGIIIDDFRNLQDTQYNVFYEYATLVENNLCYFNGGKGLHTFFSDNIDFINNTSYKNNYDLMNQGTWRGELSTAFSSNIKWINNIAVSEKGTGILAYNAAVLIGASQDNIIYQNNLFFSGITGDTSINIFDSPFSINAINNTNIIGLDPQFINESDYHFELVSNSPAIGAGSNDIVSFYDLVYNPRELGFVDIGCFQSNYFLNETNTETTAHSNIVVFPNPVMDILILNNNENYDLLTIQSTTGKIIRQFSIQPGNNQFNTSYLSSGTYLLRFSGNGALTKHLTIIKN